MKFLKDVIQKIVSFFASGKAEAALNLAASLVPKALPIVQELAALVPNRTDQEIAAAFAKFAIPSAAQYLAAPQAHRGYVLLDIATQVLATRFPGVATNILNTAVQLAVTGLKA
jgi:hypothetical protein